MAQSNSGHSIAPGPVLGPILAPAPSSDYGRNPAPVQHAPPPANPPPAINQGPVTRYGPGGIQQIPGSPPNPPYTARPFIQAP